MICQNEGVHVSDFLLPSVTRGCHVFATEVACQQLEMFQRLNISAKSTFYSKESLRVGSESLASN